LLALSNDMNGLREEAGRSKGIGGRSHGRIDDSTTRGPSSTPDVAKRGAARANTYKKGGKGRFPQKRAPAQRVAPSVDVSKPAMRFGSAIDARTWDGAQQQVAAITQQLEVSGEQRIVVEGYARSGDSDKGGASLARANTLRNALIANGLSPDKVDAIGTGQINNQQAVRIVRVEGGEKMDSKPQQAKSTVELEGQPSGQAHFVSSEAMTIEADHSAMVSILAAETKAERVYYYDPISSRGSKRFAFNAVRLDNPSKYTLDSGPFTVYADGQFLGEGISEPILPKSTAFIPYALDRSIIVTPKVTGREEIDKLITIQRGIVTTETRNIRTTALELSNRGQTLATVFVRHKLADGFALATQHADMEKLGGAHLIPVTLRPGETSKLVIEEWTPIQRNVDIRADDGIKAIALYLKKAKLPRSMKGMADRSTAVAVPSRIRHCSTKITA
jgi:outer membrane protein OmpA-like peptidoglycan-associated protein